MKELAQLIEEIGRRGGESMVIGGAAMFFYGKPQRSMDYDVWTRIEKDKLLALLSSLGFEIDSDNPALVVAYKDEVKFDFFLGRQFTNHDNERIIFDDVLLRAKKVELDQGCVCIPAIDDMKRLKKLGNSVREKDLEDIRFLDSLKTKD